MTSPTPPKGTFVLPAHNLDSTLAYNNNQVVVEGDHRLFYVG